MELEEAIDVLKNKIGDYVIADYCKDCQNKVDCVDDCNYLLAIFTVTQALEELQKENELARKSLIENSNIADERNDLLVEVQRLKDKPYGFGLIVGTKREREHWKNKIKEKIEELEENLKDFEQTDNTGRFSREKSRDYEKKEVLEELLKGE